MMEAILLLFGQGRTLDPLQMAMRAIVVFLIALVLIRISGRRSFGQRSPFDSVVVILLGATLSRAIVGASPFIATVGASLVIVISHRALAWACMRSRALERLVGGVEREVFSNGEFNAREMDAALISRTDVQESVRQKIGSRSMENVAAAILERNGEVSVIRKKA
nr:YetF domain-containing protein [Paraburkholderia sp. BL18I3N2]